jgi:hypothetical protein
MRPATLGRETRFGTSAHATKPATAMATSKSLFRIIGPLLVHRGN